MLFHAVSRFASQFGICSTMTTVVDAPKRVQLNLCKHVPVGAPARLLGLHGDCLPARRTGGRHCPRGAALGDAVGD